MQLPRKNQIEWIVWRDACADSMRSHLDSVNELRLVTNANVGWVLDENEERIVLAHGQSTSGEIDHFVIPTNSIVERVRIVAPRDGKRGRS